MRKLSKMGVVVVFSLLLIIVCIISCVLGVNTVNSVKKENAELEKTIETLKVENETFRNRIVELESENLLLKEQKIQQEPEVLTPEKTTKQYVVLSETGVNVRKENNTDSEIVKMLDANTVFEGYELENNDGSIWVETEGGFVCLKTSSGYILAKEK